ncbi:Ankyrin repeat domain containing protein [Pandoravirus dulcis]|uniref:Ankyrin repeat domain containing protein n=1 Tax=Pandoravirus dulcis TaxID=1349409 RepID=S4VQA8_9VIRU|nr:Ankyrin repeat domain containing protein [Pandoravirus dulcis]AGO82457.1 Ankyrin repeat domain containing protein [Pandoravirus dulcis]
MEQPQGPHTGIQDLPAEIVNEITGLLDNVDFCACMAASRLWRVHSPADYARRIVASRAWSGPSDLFDAGNAAAVRGLVALGRLDLSDYCASEPFWAASRGHLDLLAALHELGAPGFNVDAMDFAAIHGHVDVVAYLHRHRREGCTAYAMDHAAAHGHLPVVDFLHRHRREGCTRRAMDYAAANGHLEVVAYLHERRTEGCSVGAVNRAAANGHRDVVAYLLRERTEGSTPIALADAAANGDVAMLRLLTDDPQQPGDHRAMDAAAANGHLDAVAYLDEKRSEGCTGRAITGAARGGHFAVVLFLLDRRPTECAEGLRDAADALLGHGRTDIVGRIVARLSTPLAPSAAAFVGAACGGHLHVLHRLRKSHPSLFDQHADDMIYAAIAGGHAGVYSFCIGAASRPADLERARHRERRIVEGAMVAMAARRTGVVLRVVPILARARHLEEDTVLAAVGATGDLALVDAVMRHVRDGSLHVGSALRAAAAAGHVDVVAWILGRERDSVVRASLAGEAIRAAALVGRDDTLKAFARLSSVQEQAWHWSGAISAAHEGGHVSTLRLLRDPAFGRRTGYHSRGRPHDPEAMGVHDGHGDPPRDPSYEAWRQAARRGHLDAMRYLCSEGVYPLDGLAVMIEAAEGGHLDVVKFVYREVAVRDPWTAVSRAFACQQNRIGAWLAQAIRHGAYSPPERQRRFDWAAIWRGDVAMIVVDKRATGKSIILRDLQRFLADAAPAITLPTPSTDDPVDLFGGFEADRCDPPSHMDEVD